MGEVKECAGEPSLLWRIRPGLPSRRDVYFRAFDVSVALHVAGYDYGGNWAISTGRTLTCWSAS